VSVNFSHALFSLVFTYDNLVMQTLAWLTWSSLQETSSALHMQI